MQQQAQEPSMEENMVNQQVNQMEQQVGMSDVSDLIEAEENSDLPPDVV
jgi:hypothetical protein